MGETSCIERAAYHLLRVFTNASGSGGNPLAVFSEGWIVPPDERQQVATDLGFSETVFVDDPRAGRVAIFTPTLELPFAGHPLVGSAWLLDQQDRPVDTLRPPAGDVLTRTEPGNAYVAGRPEWAPPFEWMELGSPEEVDALEGPPGGHDLIGAYAWLGESRVRARVFPLRLGIVEDEATGAAAVRLGEVLGRQFTIEQGRGSVIEVRPRDDGLVEVGGRVALDKVCDYSERGGVTKGPNKSSQSFG